MKLITIIIFKKICTQLPGRSTFPNSEKNAKILYKYCNVMRNFYFIYVTVLHTPFIQRSTFFLWSVFLYNYVCSYVFGLTLERKAKKLLSLILNINLN